MRSLKPSFGAVSKIQYGCARICLLLIRLEIQRDDHRRDNDQRSNSRKGFQQGMHCECAKHTFTPTNGQSMTAGKPCLLSCIWRVCVKVWARRF